MEDMGELELKSVIITGADGFVGSYTTEYFLDQGIEVLALGRKADPVRLKHHDKMVYRQCDITDRSNIIKAAAGKKYDAFIHFAWDGAADKRKDYNVQMKNAIDTVECLKAAKETGCDRFVGAGSIMEYEVEAAIHTDGTRPGMAYIYGIGKHTAHCLCKPVAAELGIDFVWPMITNAYGPGEFTDRFVNSTLKKIIRKEDLQFTAATQNYDFVYVKDVAKAFYLITTKGRPFSEYMIGSGNARPLKEFIIEMKENLAKDAALCFGDIPFTGTDMPLEVFSIKRLKEDCGFIPETDFATGTAITMEWLKEQQ